MSVEKDGVSLRDVLRRIARVAFFHCGGFWLWRTLNRNKIPILMLHGVVGEDYQGQWRPMREPHGVQRLRDALILLRKHYRFVSLDDAVQMLNGSRPLEKGAMVLTFDDGYRNQFKYALPVLRELGIPATFYVATELVDKRLTYWFDRLDFALQAVEVDGRPVSVGGKRLTINAASRDELIASYAAIRKAAKAMDRPDAEMLAELDALAGALETESGRRLADIQESDDWSAVATWSELREVQADPLVDVQSHTRTHARLARVENASLVYELAGAKCELERELGTACTHFCYPSGSYDEASARAAAEAGYVSATTSDGGLNSVGQNPLTLRRVSLPNTNDRVTIAFVASGCKDFIAALWGRGQPHAS